MARRLTYWHQVLIRNDDEVIKKMYNCQKEKPIKDDFSTAIENDENCLGISMSDKEVNKLKKKINSNESHLINPFTEYFEESEEFINDCKQMPSLKQHQVPNFKGVHNSCDQCDYKASRTTIHKEKYNCCDQSNKIAKKSNLQKLLNYKNNRYYFQRH